VPMLLAAGVFNVHFGVFVLGVILARLIRFGMIAGALSYLGPRSLPIAFRILQAMGVAGAVCTLLIGVVVSVLVVYYFL